VGLSFVFPFRVRTPVLCRLCGAGYEELTLRLAKKWGADVIRDSDDDLKQWWQVFDRTAGREVPVGDRSFDPTTGSVTISRCHRSRGHTRNRLHPLESPARWRRVRRRPVDLAIANLQCDMPAALAVDRQHAHDLPSKLARDLLTALGFTRSCRSS
jgi:hypothetical protein